MNELTYPKMVTLGECHKASGGQILHFNMTVAVGLLKRCTWWLGQAGGTAVLRNALSTQQPQSHNKSCDFLFLLPGMLHCSCCIT